MEHYITSVFDVPAWKTGLLYLFSRSVCFPTEFCGNFLYRWLTTRISLLKSMSKNSRMKPVFEFGVQLELDTSPFGSTSIFKKFSFFSPCSQWSNRNFGRNVRRRLWSSRKFCFNRTTWLRFISHWLVSLVSDWSVWQSGKNPGPKITSRTLRKRWFNRSLS